MTDKNDYFPIQDPAQLLQNSQIQKLMKKLQSMDPDILQQAASLASSGNISKAQNLLSPILQDDDVIRLRQEMEEHHGRS